VGDRMKIRIILTGFLCVILCLALFGSTAGQNIGIKAEDLDIGDFLEIEYWRHYSYPDMEFDFYATEKMEVIGTDTINVEGFNYNVVKLKSSLNGKYVYEDGSTARVSGSGISYIEKSDNRDVKVSITINAKKGANSFETEIIRTAINYTSTRANKNIIPMVGEQWTEKTVWNVTSKRTENGDVEGPYTETETEIKEYKCYEEGSVTTDLGTFVTVNIEETDLNSEEYAIFYVDKSMGISVKSEYFNEHGEKVAETEFVRYKIYGVEVGPSDEEDDNGLFDLGKIGGLDVFYIILISIIVIVVLIKVGIIFARRSSKMKKKKHPRAKKRTPRHYCNTCGSPLKYIDQYESWWCDNCRRYI
jgi:hypothetical protein